MSALLAICAAGSLAAQTAAVLEPGAAIEEEIAPGEFRLYRLELAAGRPVRIGVEQRGADVVVAVAGLDGRQLVAVDNPNDRQGPERLFFEAPVAGTYRVELRARTRGRYRIVAEELSTADAERLAAERAATAGAELALRGTAEGWRQAILPYQEALTYWQERGEVHEQARLLYSLGALHRKLDETRAALALLDRTLPLWRAAGDVHGEADTRNLMALLHEDEGESRAARELYGQALALRAAAGDRCGQAQILSNLGLVDHHRGELHQARELYERALALCDETEDPDFAASLLLNLGGFYEALGELHEALAYTARALPLLRTLGARQKEAVTLNNLGTYSRRLGEYQKALEHYQAALEVLDEIEDRRLEATVRNSLGAAYRSLGEPRRALAYLRDALALRRAVGDRRGEGVTLHNLGAVYDQLGEPQAAFDLYHQALELRRALDDRRGEATTLDQIGLLLAGRGELGEALETFDRALELQRSVGDLRSEARILSHLGEARIASSQPRQAVEPLNQALALHRQIKDRTGEAVTLPVLARAERRLGELESARSHLEAALDIIESLGTEIPSPDLRATFLAVQREAYESTLDVLMELHRRDPYRGHDRKAFEVSERARARTLLELVNDGGAVIRQGVDGQLLGRRKTLQQRLTAKAAKQRTLLSRRRDPRRAAEVEAELEAIFAELQQVEAEIRRASPGYAALTQPRPLAANELQRLLDPNTVLLEYALGEERSFLWAVGPGFVESFELPSRQEIEAATRGLYELWSTLDVHGQDAEKEAAAALGKQLLGPVTRHLEGGERLVIVADGALHYLPFAALPVPVPGSEPLVAEHEIVTLPSASLLALLRRGLARRPPADGMVAVVADPIFARHDPRVTPSGDAASGGASQAPRATAEAPFPGLNRLPSSRFEAEAVAKILPSETLTLLGSQARRDAVLDGRLSGHRILHFATHGVLDSQRPQLSGLVFSLFDAQGRPLDGFLPLFEIYNLRLSAELVVLSGCQTALGREVRGEGLVGLTRGFFHAGAARVVASLWRVQDRATAELMSRFYRALLDAGQPPAAALRTAQLSLWRETKWKDPYYWAAFVHQGDWRQGEWE